MTTYPKRRTSSPLLPEGLRLCDVGARSNYTGRSRVGQPFLITTLDLASLLQLTHRPQLEREDEDEFGKQKLGVGTGRGRRGGYGISWSDGAEELFAKEDRGFMGGQNRKERFCSPRRIWDSWPGEDDSWLEEDLGFVAGWKDDTRNDSRIRRGGYGLDLWPEDRHWKRLSNSPRRIWIGFVAGRSTLETTLEFAKEDIG
ncbi:hypothetical protein LZ554_000903 [Drepanopeziza brunnea f. sp. 'monogermtubi']|nr:hypothetical protein LZ554_000903 [Drepanopeziza brunnea f. sp. 'monogermtubi']